MLADVETLQPVSYVKLFGRWTFDDVQVKCFRKAQCQIVERLTNSLMMHGKKLMAVRIVKHAMEISHLLTDLNPVQVIVDAVINRQSTFSPPVLGKSFFGSIKTIAECLADELTNASKGSLNSDAIKKDEIERVAKANR